MVLARIREGLANYSEAFFVSLPGPTLELNASWKRPNLQVVARVQAVASRRIVGAAAVSLKSE